MAKRKYKKLDDIEHVLKRPGMYIGSISPHTDEKYLLRDDKMVKEKITYNPGFLKIFDEIVMNSVDESKRAGSKLNIIKIKVSNDAISVWDNGGIPVEMSDEGDEWIPEMIFSNLKAGSNFEDATDKRTGAGLNGVGSTLTNIYSKVFKVVTCDGKKQFTQNFKNNMRIKGIPKIVKAKRNHTEISYKPDLEKFGMADINDTHFKLIQKRIFDIAGCNPKLKIYFNNKVIDIKSFQDYTNYYSDEIIYEENKKKTWSIGIAPSDNGFQQVSFANATETYDGGTHLDYVMNQIISSLREFFKKKHKVDVKPSELKNHMFFFLNSTIINPSFSSQTKEKMITEVKDFGFEYKVTDVFIKKIIKSEIIESILDWVEQKKLADESKLERNLNRGLSKTKVEKLIDAKSRDRWKCSMGIFEGDSAISAFRKYRVPEIMGAFALKGKFTNVSDITTSKLVNNKEVINLMASLGLKLGHEPSLKDLRYGRILLYTDADVDGNSISALLLNFFHRYWPALFDRKMVFKVETPIVSVYNKKAKKKILFYTQTEYDNWCNKQKALANWEIKYKKGLAALVDDEYKTIINTPKMTLITKDDLSKQSLNIWFGKDSNLRKTELLK